MHDVTQPDAVSSASAAPETGKASSPRRLGRIVIGLVILVGLGVAITSLWSWRAPSPAQATRTIQPVRATIRNTIVANGTIVPRKEVIVKPQISGVIDKLLVNRGDRVTVGDLLAVIRPLPNPGAINNAEAAVRNARIEREQAKREFDRIDMLYRQNMVSRAEYDLLQRNLRVSEQRLAAAERQRDIVHTGASIALGRNASEVRATVAGTILDRPVEIGGVVIETNTFNEGTTIVSIAEMTDLIFKGKVDEPDAGGLREGMPVTVVAGALPTERFEGRLEFIALKAVEKDGLTTFEIRARLALKPDHVLRAGYSATGEVITDERNNVLSLPERYVQFREGKAFVKIETTSGVVEQQEVSVGLSDGLITEIVSGLTGESRVREE